MSTLGLLMMVGAVLWLAYALLFRCKDGAVEFGVVELMVVALVWMAGRVIAGKSIIAFLLD